MVCGTGVIVCRGRAYRNEASVNSLADLLLACAYPHPSLQMYTCISIVYRRRWRSVPVKTSSRASCSLSSTSMRWWWSAGSLGRRAGTGPTPTTRETSPSVSMCSTTTWRPTTRWLSAHHAKSHYLCIDSISHSDYYETTNFVCM